MFKNTLLFKHLLYFLIPKSPVGIFRIIHINDVNRSYRPRRGSAVFEFPENNAHKNGLHKPAVSRFYYRGR